MKEKNIVDHKGKFSSGYTNSFPKCVQPNWISFYVSIIFITTILFTFTLLAKCDELSSDGVIFLNRNGEYLHESQPQPYSSASVVFGYRTKRKSEQIFQQRFDKTSVNNILESLNLVSNEQSEDICKGHCICNRTKSAFISIYCDFQENQKLSKIFGSNFLVPSDATSITIRLAASTSFRLGRGFFRNNKVNSLTIEGARIQTEQVEIMSEAFQGNLGPYPDILLVNVSTVIVRSKAFSASGKFTVRNCNELIVYPDAFVNAQINGLFVNINDLRIFEKAFNSAQAKLRIESSHIDNIYRFEASLREIRFINTTIGTINGGTFDVMNINSIVFEGCRIGAIKARAITEKLYSKHVSITGAIIGSIESEAIYGSGISELILTKNKIESIQSNAIYATTINATITQNNIKRLENNWLRVKDWSNIIIERNQFGVFGNMVLEETKQPVVCHFDGNSLTQPLPGSLNITNRYCVLREISVNLPCRCNLDWLEALSSHDLRSETYCTIDDKLTHCFNSTTFNMLKYLNEVCDESKTTLDCVSNMNLKKINGRFFTPEELASDDHLVLKLIYVLGGCLLLCLLVVIVILVICRCLCSKSKGETDYASTSHVNDHVHEFSNEDLGIIKQTMNTLQRKHPDIYKRVNARTQILLQQDLSNNTCVSTISKILDLLSTISNESNDFSAFNQVLTQHLQPRLPLPTAPTPALTDPIYSEPTLRGIDAEDGFYTSSTIVPISTENYIGNTQTSLPEHIYAEPNCAQQPLLPNEYASPADRNVDPLDVYTEPINNRDGPQQITPYSVRIPDQSRKPQYALPTSRKHQINLFHPSDVETNSGQLKSQNLPDVLSQNQNVVHINSQRNRECTENNKPITKVQRIAQNLQSLPKPQVYPNSSQLNRPQLQSLVRTPVYAKPDDNHGRLRRPIFDVPQMASPERDEDFELDMRGASALPISKGPEQGHQTYCSSDHSGGSNETVEIDDIIEYVDA